MPDFTILTDELSLSFAKTEGETLKITLVVLSSGGTDTLYLTPEDTNNFASAIGSMFKVTK